MTLAALSTVGGRRFTDSDVAALEQLARQAAELLHAERVEPVAIDIDAVTGLYNRTSFLALLTESVREAQTGHRPLTLVVIDIDDFSRVNERLGQLGGDRVLAAVAAQLRELEPDRVAGRVGGDAFAVIIDGGRLPDGERLFARLYATTQRYPPAGAVALGLSAGIAVLRPDDLALTLYERADEALAKAKRTGKGTAVAASGPRP
jgi:diguanylate cyclase